MTGSTRDPLTTGAALVDLGPRTQLELTGADRAAFLHNMCTNEIRKLPVGLGCEAFLTDARGHVRGFVYVLAGTESIVLETVGGQGTALAAHLDRYIIREQVEVHDRSEAWGELLIAGPTAADVVGRVTDVVPPSESLAHVEGTFAGTAVSVRRVEFTQPGGYLLSIDRAQLGELRSALVDAGAEPIDAAVFESARIAAGTPLFGRDISDANLPQEVARDARAISFNKGCYIGQETVARIDALGHVNKTLVGLRIDTTTVPPVDTPVVRDGQDVGRITSAALATTGDAVVALAYVRRGSNLPGTTLQVAEWRAEIVSPSM